MAKTTKELEGSLSSGKEWEDHVVVGKNVLILTRGYHYVGKIAYVNALRIVLSQATLFVDVGQIDNAVAGKWDGDAKGRQIGNVDLLRPNCDTLNYRGDLPNRAIG
jgi:hypothetical protein